MEKDGREYLPMGPVRSAEERNRVDADASKTYGYAQVNPDHPFDISGPWHNGYKFRLTVDDLEPKPTPFTADGRFAGLVAARLVMLSDSSRPV